MKKSEKRRIGEARQAEFAKQNLESGLTAQKQAHKIAAKRKATADKIKAAKALKEAADKAKGAMRDAGEAASSAAKGMVTLVDAYSKHPDSDDWPEVLDATDETAYPA